MKFPKTTLVAGSLLFVLTARIAAEGQGVFGQGDKVSSDKEMSRVVPGLKITRVMMPGLPGFLAI